MPKVKKDKNIKSDSEESADDRENSEEDEEEEDEEEEYDENFVNDAEESEDNDARYDRNVYRDEGIFKKNKKNEEDNEKEEAELEKSLGSSDLEVTKKKKPKKKLHKVNNKKNEELRKEYQDLDDGFEVKKEDNVEENSQKKYNDDFIDRGDIDAENEEEKYDEFAQEKLGMVSREFMSEEDKKIVEADYPERLLLRYDEKDLQFLYQEIKDETEWICMKIDKGNGDSPSMKKKIFLLLEFYKKEFRDVPYIVTYKNSVYEPDFNKKDVWDIFEYDKEYQKLVELKNKVNRNFAFLENVLNEKTFRNMKEKYIDNAKTIQELKNMLSYIEYIREKAKNTQPKIKKDPENENFDAEFDEQKEEYIPPVKKSLLSSSFSVKLEEINKKFCLDSNDIASNIELIKNKEPLSKLLHPPSPSCALCDMLKPLISKNTGETRLIEIMCNIIAKEMQCHPFIKEFAYNHLRNNCYVSTNPTEEGETQLDVFNPSFRTKRIRERPVKSFDNDLFLDVLEKEKRNLIAVQIEINEKEDEAKEFKYILSQALNHNSDDENSSINFIKTEKSEDNSKNEWNLLRESVITLFLQSIKKQFLLDIKKELKEKAENFVINKCAEKFYDLLMSGPYKVVDDNDQKNDDENQISDKKFRNDDLPKVMSFVYDPNEQCTYCVVLNENGECIDEKVFTTSFQKPMRHKRQNDENNKEDEQLNNEKRDEENCRQLIIKYEPNLIVIGANDLKNRYIKDQLSSIAGNIENIKSPWVTFGDLSIPIIYSNSQISEIEFPNSNMFVRQGVSLARYMQNPLQEILQLWKEDISENYCLKIKLHSMQKFVNQNNLMEKLETKAIEVVNNCGFDLNRALEFAHLRNSLQFISGFGPRKARNFIEQLSNGQPKSRKGILETQRFKIGKKLGVSFLNFIKIKTDVTKKNFSDDENDRYDLLDMTRIPMENYDLAKKFVNEITAKDEKKNRKKKVNDYDKDNEHIEEVIRDPKKLQKIDLNEFIQRQMELNKNKNPQFQTNLKNALNLITKELEKPFDDPRYMRKDLDPTQIFYLLIGDENFKKGVITVAKVTRVDQAHVQCRLQNDLSATVWYKDIFDSDVKESEAKEKMQSLFKPGATFEARVKSIDFNNYKTDLMTKPSEMESHKNYIPNVDDIRDFFEYTEDDKKNISYINLHSQKNQKYQPRDIKYNKFRNISYTDCCNYLKHKNIGECVFRPSSLGNNNITLSYKFYDNVICHIDIVEEEKYPGETIGRKLRISNETYSGLEEIYKRYVIPCSQFVKEAKNNRKFIVCASQNDFEKKLKEEKLQNPKIINYNYTILKDFPGYIVLGYVPKSNPILEFIKVKPRGLYFHDNYYNSLDDITNFFKNEYGNEKYREFVRKSAPPNVQYHRSIESFNNNNSYNKEYYGYHSNNSINIKEEDNWGNNNSSNNHNADKICNYCQGKGHIARECPKKSERNNNHGRDRDRNNNRDNWGGNKRGGNKFMDKKRNRDENDRGYRRHDNNSYQKSNFSWRNKNDDGWGSGNNNNNKDSWGSQNDNNNNNNNDGWGSGNNDNNDGWGSENNDNKGDSWGDANQGSSNIKQENIKQEDIKKENDDEWNKNDDGGW